MDLLFIKDKINSNKYEIFNNGRVIFYAYYDSLEKTKKIYDETKTLLMKGYYDSSKTYRLLDFLIPYVIDIYTMNGSIVNNRRTFIYSKIFPYPTHFFTDQTDKYEAIVHIGNQISIFRNDVQIAVYNKGYYTNKYPWEMKLTCDKDAPISLLCLLAVYLHSNFRDEHSSEGGIPPLNISFQKKKRNSRWEPKQ